MDLRYGLRRMRMNAGPTAVAVIILAAGIAANTTIFSVVNALVFRPLPYADAERLVAISEGNESLKSWGGVSYPDFMDLKAGNQVLAQMALIVPEGANVSIGGEPERVPSVLISQDLVPMLGISLAAGRPFAQPEYLHGASPAVLISNAFWKRRLGADPDAAGRVLKIDGKQYVIAGVLGADFRLAYFAGFEPEVWLPLTSGGNPSRGSRSCIAIGKLKPGVVAERAQADLNIIAGRLEEQHPETNAGWKIMVSALRGAVDPVAYALLAVLVFSVLGIVCTNVVNLLLAQTAARERELAVRAAMGANRWRLGKQLFHEGLMLAISGTGLGILISFWCCRIIRTTAEGTNLELLDLRPDARVLAATVFLFFATTMAVALLPAVQLSRVDLNQSLRCGASTLAGTTRRRFRTALIAAEVMLSFVLLVGAGLVVKSWTRLWHVDLGYRTENVLTMRLSLPGSRYPEPRQQAAFYEALLDRLKHRGEFRFVGAGSALPTWGQQVPFTTSGDAGTRQGEERLARMSAASPGFFGALSIEPRAGRLFADEDSETSLAVAVINQSLARRYWKDRNPLGEQIEVAGRTRTIVGIAGDMRSVPFHKTPMPEIWLPFSQSPAGTMILAVQPRSGDPLRMAEAIKRDVQAVDPEQPVDRIRTMEQVQMQDMGVIRTGTRVLAILAVGAIALASVGLYGILSHSVSRRSAEFGVRMALGARRTDVLVQVMKEGLALTALGLAPGIAISLALGRVLSNSLYGVRPLEPLILAGLALLLLLVALLACYLPARRATRIDPAVALRGE
jgi:putative ABC transport system permease protein